MDGIEKEIQGLEDSLNNNQYSAKRKTTLLETAERVKFALEKLIQNVNTHEIVAEMRAKWGISGSRSRAIIGLAYKELEKYNRESRDKVLDQQLSSLKELLALARADKDYKLVLEINKEINKIKGLYEATKVDLNHTGTIKLSFGDWTPDEESTQE